MTAIVLMLVPPVAVDADTGVTPGGKGYNAVVQSAQGGGSTNHVASSPGGATADSGVHYTTTYHPCDPSSCPGFRCPSGQTPMLASTHVPGWVSVGSPSAVCVGAKAVVTAAAVANAFRHIGLPTPALHIQPVKGRTLVNFKTNFYATGGAEFTRTVTLLGQRVRLRIHVDHYDFAFGDGQHLTTTAAGAAYPDLTDHHVYLRKGVVHPSLTTTWAADYRINGGAWQDVTGTVTVHGPTRRLEVTTARPVLVNPYGS